MNPDDWTHVTRAARAWAWMARFLIRNRVSLALLSLAWVLWRSGSQPRRLTYPCQQAALGNLGIFSFLLVPGALVQGRCRHHHRRRGVFLPLAGLVLLGSGGIFLYVQKNTSKGSPPGMQATTTGTGTPALVGIARDPDGIYTDLELERLIRRAVQLAGGLEPVMLDRRGGGGAPWNAPDGDVDVIILPNMSGLQPGLNTDPRVTRTVVKLAWEAGAASVKLGGAATGDNWTAFGDQGYDLNQDRFLDQDPRVALLDLNDTGTTGACPGERQYNNVTPITLPTSGPGAAVARSSYYVHNELLKTDVMIVVPSLKNHDLGTITIGLKMRIGTAPQDLYFAPWLGCSDEPFLRWELHNYNQATKYPWNIGAKPTSEPEAVQRSLVDLNLVRPHDFVVVDALVGCESGPLNHDEPVSRVKSIVAGRDTVALDTIGALIMGYDPDRIPCLTMANDSERLGVKDRRLITVAGEHVRDARVNFRLDHPTGYATPYRSESVSPTLAGISLVEGQPLAVGASAAVACTGVSDNVGVIKAELALKPAPLPNLLTNGGFDSGSQGWSTYYSSWGGNDGQINFQSAPAGRVGAHALHLSLSPGKDDSFAVYQQVPVTPGKAYQVDALWKGNHYGHDTWYEIMLIDGAWDPVQADTGGSAVLNNHMFAYDTNASAKCPGGNPLTASFDWTSTGNQHGLAVDNCWNDRDGVRIATGSAMTVVLKAGSCCGTNRADVWFDEVSLTEAIDREFFVVGQMLDPPASFEIPWDAAALPLGWYEARVSVYDAMMNEASITRTIQLIAPETPVITASAGSFEHTVVAGAPCPQNTLTVFNGGIGTLNYTIAPSDGWLSVNPSSAHSDGPPGNAHAITYQCETLGVGDHQATLTVADPAAYNSPQVITVTVHVQRMAADLDGDTDVDQSDFAILQRCLSGAGMPHAANCGIANLDVDIDVDSVDAGILQNCYSGAKLLPPAGCMQQ